MKKDVAFVIWNDFQLQQIKPILEVMKNATLIIEKRIDNKNFFKSNLLNDIDNRIIYINYTNMLELDGKYSIIVAQTPFSDIHLIKNSKIVFLQYGYAKDSHNFGMWRLLANTTLTFGNFASEQIESFCHTIAVGNPRYDIWYKDRFHIDMKIKYSEKIDSNKKTIVYLPTWGELSSVDLYIETLNNLVDKYNIIIKPHHITKHIEKKRLELIKKTQLIKIDSSEDSLGLISVADLVISDYSGAIFDALYCNKNLILLDIDSKLIKKSKRVSKNSLEISNREFLGKIVKTPNNLEKAIKEILQKNILCNNANSLRKKLFIETDNASLNIVKALDEIIYKKIKYPAEREKYIKNYGKKFLSKSLIYKLKLIYFMIRGII